MTFMICAAVLAAMCVPCFAAAPQRGSTLRSPTVPPSAYQQSLRPTRNEAAKYQLRNELVTGNVSGGRHFRGSVPYSPRYEFSGRLPSNEINSFLRRSSASPYGNRTPSGNNSYYLPSRTVTSLNRVGQSGLVPPRVTFPGGTGRYQLPPPTGQIYIPDTYRRRGPLELSISELELKVLRQAQRENPNLQDITKRVRDNIIRDILSKQDMEDADADKPDEKPEQKIDERFSNKPLEALKPFDPAKPMDPVQDREQVRPIKEIDEYTQQIEELEEIIIETDEEPAEDEEKTEEQTEQEEGLFSKIDHQTAMGIIKPYKTFKEYAKAKFSGYIALGDGYMKQGKFYKAADAYTLASVYDLDSARAHGGRGLALFAAGEYLTSSEYIEKALSSSPRYAKQKVDLKSFVGMEIVDKRLSNILKWYESNNSPRFILLASYIYYQLGDFEKAAKSLDAAAVNMASSASVEAMRNAIESAKAAEK